MKKVFGNFRGCIGPREHWVHFDAEGSEENVGIGSYQCHGYCGVDNRYEIELVSIQIDKIELPSGIRLTGEELHAKHPKAERILVDLIFDRYADGKLEIEWDEGPLGMVEEEGYWYKNMPKISKEDSNSILDAVKTLNDSLRDLFKAAGIPDPAEEIEGEEWNTYHFTCPECGNEFEADWTCAADDDCPHCGERHISPDGVLNDGEYDPLVDKDSPLLYLLYVVGDVDPTTLGPFHSDEVRLAVAKRIRKEEGDEDGIYRLTISNNVPDVSPFTGFELGE